MAGIFEQRVYLDDVDAMGCVYHANYLKFCERARTHMMESYGFYHADAIQQRQNFFVMRHTEMDYLAPAYLKDTLRIETHIIRVTGASVTFEQRLLRQETVIGILKAQMVYVDHAFKIARMPEELKQVFMGILHRD
jgi:acyl-CoA thioester hydrolase